MPVTLFLWHSLEVSVSKYLVNPGQQTALAQKQVQHGAIAPGCSHENKLCHKQNVLPTYSLMTLHLEEIVGSKGIKSSQEHPWPTQPTWLKVFQSQGPEETDTIRIIFICL